MEIPSTGLEGHSVTMGVNCSPQNSLFCWWHCSLGSWQKGEHRSSRSGAKRPPCLPFTHPSAVLPVWVVSEAFTFAELIAYTCRFLGLALEARWSHLCTIPLGIPVSGEWEPMETEDIDSPYSLHCHHCGSHCSSLKLHLSSMKKMAPNEWGWLLSTLWEMRLKVTHWPSLALIGPPVAALWAGGEKDRC